MSHENNESNKEIDQEIDANNKQNDEKELLENISKCEKELVQIESEFNSLEQLIKEDKALLKKLKDDYNQTESCLQNWKGKYFSQSEEFRGDFLCENDETSCYCAPLAVLKATEKLADEKGEEEASSFIYKSDFLFFPRYIQGLTDLDSWELCWLIGVTPKRIADRLNAKSMSGKISVKKDLSEGCAKLLTEAQENSALGSDNNHVIIANDMINETIGKEVNEASESPIDPFSIAFTKEKDDLEKRYGFEECSADDYDFVQQLVGILSVDTTRGLISVASEAPIDPSFILLDLKVYHPFIESVTNLMDDCATDGDKDNNLNETEEEKQSV